MLDSLRRIEAECQVLGEDLASLAKELDSSAMRRAAATLHAGSTGHHMTSRGLDLVDTADSAQERARGIRQCEAWLNSATKAMTAIGAMAKTLDARTLSRAYEKTADLLTRYARTLDQLPREP